MLHLKRVQYFTDFLKCKMTGEIIRYGDYYYEDDEDGTIIKASEYAKVKEQDYLDNFDYSQLNKAESIRDYEQALKDYEKEYLKQTILGRKRTRDTEGF